MRSLLSYLANGKYDKNNRILHLKEYFNIRGPNKFVLIARRLPESVLAVIESF